MAQSAASFVNQVWTFSDATAIKNNYLKVGIDVFL